MWAGAPRLVTSTNLPKPPLSLPPQYYVLRQKGTERPGTGPLNKNYADGEYTCAGCGRLLFTSDMKFDSGCGWPAFWCVDMWSKGVCCVACVVCLVERC